MIDKDLAGSLLARDLEADLYVMATDVDGVYTDWGTPDSDLDAVTTAELERGSFPAGSMGPKVEAAAEFAEATGKRAAIGSLDDIDAIVAGSAGTSVVASLSADRRSEEEPDGRRLVSILRSAGYAR